MEFSSAADEKALSEVKETLGNALGDPWMSTTAFAEMEIGEEGLLDGWWVKDAGFIDCSADSSSPDGFLALYCFLHLLIVLVNRLSAIPMNSPMAKNAIAIPITTIITANATPAAASALKEFESSSSTEKQQTCNPIALAT